MMRGGVKQTVTHQGQAVYSMGRQAMIAERQDRRAPMITHQFDGVSRDRMVATFNHQSSGDKCAEYRYFKQ